jgi:glucose/mannose transport system substrate-binding protein
MKLRSLVFGSALLLGALGCSSDDKATGDAGTAGKTSTTKETLQLFSWWTAPGEVEALTALENAYGEGVYQDSEVTPGNWSEKLGAQIDDSPWDVFQLSASDIDKLRTDHPDAVAELDDVYADADLNDAIIPDIKDVITREGHQFGVVTGVHRNNSFIYNQRIFTAQGLTPPTRIDELLEVCATLKEAGITPVATDMDTWVLRIFFDEILAGTMGAEAFDDFIKGKVSAEDADVKANIESAIATFDTILTEYVDVERSAADGYEWFSAADDLHEDKAAMMFHGDWAKGYLLHLGFDAGPDFGVLGPPGASDLFVYGADMFGMPATAPHPALAKEFLTVVASKKGQVQFNKYKGATPMRTDVRDELDEPGKLSLDGLINAKVRMPGHGNAGWDAGMEAFAKDHDQAALLQVYIDTPP